MVEEVRLLFAGYCLHPEAMTRRGGRWSPARFAAGFSLIQHARQGPILFDTGYSEHFLAEAGKWPGMLYACVTPVRLEAAQTARRQLAQVGVGPRDVRHIVVSHFHADHVAGLRDFPAAKIWCTRAAWQSVRRARGLRAVAKGFLPGLMPPGIEQQLIFIDDAAPAPLPSFLASFGQGRDLFNDGTLLSVDLPGHAVGQVGLYLPAAPEASLFLVADAAWSLHAIVTGAQPPWASTAFLGDTRDYRVTLGRLHTLHQAMPALAIVPSHDISAIVESPMLHQ